MYLIESSKMASDPWNNTSWKEYLDQNIEKYPSIAILSDSPTSCQLHSHLDPIQVFLIKKPIHFERALDESKSNKPFSEGIMNQISSLSLSLFSKAGPSTALSSVLEPEPILLKCQDPNYNAYSTFIKDSRFYLIALETCRFLSDDMKPQLSLDFLSQVMANHIKRTESSLDNIHLLHASSLHHESIDSFLKGLISHILYKSHWMYAYIE